MRRFPESESPSAFWANLAGGIDMVTENGRRWPVGLHGTPARFGKLLEYVNFDATFFAVHGKQASVRGPSLYLGQRSRAARLPYVHANWLPSLASSSMTYYISNFPHAPFLGLLKVDAAEA